MFTGLMEFFCRNISEALKLPPDPSDDKRFSIEPRRPNIGLTKVLAVATGAAVVASSVAGLKYDKTALR